jgi:hypothetical protein
MTERELTRLSDSVVNAPPELLKLVLPDVLGIGRGASETAIQSARKGMLLEWVRYAEGVLGYDEDTLAPPKQRGRPRKVAMWSKDAIRAYALWELARCILKSVGKPDGGHIEVGELVRLAQRVETAIGVCKRDSLFSGGVGTYAPSVSRGKKILGINDQWNSPTCEEIHANFPQMTEPE